MIHSESLNANVKFAAVFLKLKWDYIVNTLYTLIQNNKINVKYSYKIYTSLHVTFDC